MQPWPPEPGAYLVGDPQAPVAVCTLTSEDLMAPLVRLAGVAIVGKVYTANNGIERIVRNLVANPAIRFLIVCGKDSPLFRPGQSLAALFARGIDDEHVIIGAQGYEPVLATLTPEIVQRVRNQIELVDWIGEESPATLEEGIQRLRVRNPGPLADEETIGIAPVTPTFKTILPGGQREPLQYDPKGYFVITVDVPGDQLIVRHFTPSHSLAHEMHGRSAGPMLLGLLREGLVTQLSHAGYLGEELAKAQAALQFGLYYIQDRPLRARDTVPDPTGAPAPEPQPAAAPAPRRMPPLQPTIGWAAIEAAAIGATIDAAVHVTQVPAADCLIGAVLEGAADDPFSTFRRTPHEMQILWTATTPVVMGGAADLKMGAILRVLGTLDPQRSILAQRIAILTDVAQIQDA